MRDDDGTLKCDACHIAMVPQRDDDGSGISPDTVSEACPVCAIPLMKATLGRLPLSVCTRCDGMLIAMRELHDLIAASPAGPLGAQPASPVGVRVRVACPHCGRPMEARSYAGGGSAAIDTCEDCGLNWLDPRELARMAGAPGAGYAASVADEADSMANFDPEHSASYFNSGRTGDYRPAV
jgi:Zn-finger nucleic acid-binding protein